MRMNREYLEGYAQREEAELKRLFKRIKEGIFSFEKDRYPPDERFVNIRKPVALTTGGSVFFGRFWAQVPFCGSLILRIAPYQQDEFEKLFFKVREIPEIIDFIKETGRLQIILNSNPLSYVGLDYLKPFFLELNPPVHWLAPLSLFENEKEVQKAQNVFLALSKVRYVDFLRRGYLQDSVYSFFEQVNSHSDTYTYLKISGYNEIAEEIENLLIDDPPKAMILIEICSKFIESPARQLRGNLWTYSLQAIKSAGSLPLVYQPQEIRFPYEIGQFLLKKMTHAPLGLRACYDIIDHYDAYDLQKVQKSLNEAIIANHPDIINKSADDLSEILDNLWNDTTMPNRIKGIKIVVPILIAAIGGVAAGLPGVAAGGFLGDLGFKVAEKAVEKFFSVKGEGLSEKLAKLRTKSYQANVYDFKKKYPPP